MTSPTILHALRQLSLSLMAVGFTAAVQAAPIDLVPGEPSLDAFGSNLTYTYTPVCASAKNAGTFGVCGTGQGSSAFTGAQNWSLSYGRLTISDPAAMVINPGTYPVTDVNGPDSNYTLTVILGFDSTGSALSGILASDPWSEDANYTSAAAAYGTTSNAAFQSGTLLTGTPTNATSFGYGTILGHSGFDDAGTFEFILNNVGGDMAAFGSSLGVIASTRNLSHPLLPSGAPVETWDSKGVSFWKYNFSAADIDVGGTSPVPLPATAWLLAPALAALAPRLKRRSRAS
jgi:hypothetical protein